MVGGGEMAENLVGCETPSAASSLIFVSAAVTRRGGAPAEDLLSQRTKSLTRTDLIFLDAVAFQCCSYDGINVVLW